MSYNPLNNQLVSGSRDGEMLLWDMDNVKPIRSFVGHGSTVMSVQLGAHKIVSGSGDRCIKVWDIQSGRCMSTLLKHTEAIMGVIADDNKIVSCSADKNVIVWDFLRPIKTKYSN